MFIFRGQVLVEDSFQAVLRVLRMNIEIAAKNLLDVRMPMLLGFYLIAAQACAECRVRE